MIVLILMKFLNIGNVLMFDCVVYYKLLCVVFGVLEIL